MGRPEGCEPSKGLHGGRRRWSQRARVTLVGRTILSSGELPLGVHVGL